MMDKRSWFLRSVFALALILSLGFALYAFYYRDHPVRLILPGDGTDDKSVNSPQGPVKKIEVFFANNDGSSLTTLEKEIPGNTTLIEQIRTTIQTLTDTPPSQNLMTAIPQGTKLQSLFVDSSGIAYLDFSREIQQNHIGGLTAELLTIGSIVNTLLFNFKEIKGVQLLVEGSEIETLAGHIDCTKPFPRLLVVENK